MPLSNNTKGAALMALAMAAFTCNDTLVKMLTADLNVGQIIFIRGLLTSLMVYGVARYAGALVPLRELRHPMVVLRTVFEIAATISFLMALRHMPLGNISAIMQCLPLAVTLGAALFLKEPVGWRRWGAIFIGFLGVIIIVQPGPDGFTMTASLALVSMFCAAGRDLITSAIPSHVPSLAITVTTAVANAVFGLFLIVPFGGWQTLDVSHAAKLFFASALIFVGYQSLILAMRLGEISFIAPFRYVSLVWALSLGFLVFGDVPSATVMIGATIVVISGLYAFYREHRRNRLMAAARTAAGE